MKKGFKRQLSPLERFEQWVVICPNNRIFQTWIFLISVMGVVSSLFYVFCAVVRHDLEEWHEDDHEHETEMEAYMDRLSQIVFYTEMIFLVQAV